MKKLILIALSVTVFSCSKDEPENKYTPDGEMVGVRYECDSDNVEYFCVDEEQAERVRFQVNMSGMLCPSIRFIDLLGEEIVGKFASLSNNCQSIVYTE